jgi:hypothetical protein
MASLGAPGLFVGPLVLALGLAAVRLYDRDQRARRLALAALPSVTQSAPSGPSNSAKILPKKEVAP